MQSLISHLPQYWTEGTIRYLEGLRNGLTEPFPLREDPPPVTPYRQERCGCATIEQRGSPGPPRCC